MKRRKSYNKYAAGTVIDPPMVSSSAFKRSGLAKALSAAMMVNAMTGMNNYNNSIIAIKTVSPDDLNDAENTTNDTE